MRGPQGGKTELNSVSLLLLSILYMASLGLVCPSEVRAAGAASGSTIVVGGDGGAANVADVAGDIVATVTSTAGNDTQFKTTPSSVSATISAVYGDSLARPSPDSFVMPPPDTVWHTVSVTNAGNASDSFVFNTLSVKYRGSGATASDSVTVTVWNAAGSAVVSSLTLPADSTGQVKVSVFVKSTAPRKDTLDIVIQANAKGGTGGDPGGYTGNNGILYAGDGDDTIGLAVGVVNRNPISNAGPDTVVVPGNTVPLSAGASSDPDADALTYLWTQLAGPARTLTPSSTVVNPSFVSDTAFTGNYVFELRVTDPSGDTAVDTIGIGAGNSAPVANAGPDTYRPNNDTATLNGSSSSDINGDTLSYLWTKLSGPACTINNASSVVATVFMTNKGAYVFQLRVNDQADTAFDTAQVTVLNTKPVANAGLDSPARPNNDTTLLVATASTDPDTGDTLTYSWSKLSGPAVTIGSSTGATATAFMTLEGTYVFQLIVNDGTDTSVDTVQVTVVNTKPVANAGPDTTVTFKDTVSLSGAASTDADTGDTLTYSWQQIGGPAAALVPSGGVVNPQFNADTVATYTFRLTVNDGTDTGSDTILINAINTIPIANAGLDSGIAAGSTFGLNGGASTDANGSVLTYSWTQIGGPARTLTPNANVVSPSFVTDTAFIGNYIFQLVVHDGFDSSAPDTIVAATGNVPPVANAGLDNSILHPDTFTLNGSASSDANGDTLTYIWTQLSGPAVTLIPGGGVVNPQFYAAVTAQYVFQLVVLDGTDTSVPDAVTVTGLNTPPIANAGVDTGGTAGIASVLSGSASSDPNGDTISYSWAQMSGPGVTLTPSSAAISPSFTPTVSGSYEFRLSVTDGVDTGIDTVVITVGAGTSARVGFIGDTHQIVDTFGNATIRVVIRDSNGNVVQGDTVTFTVTHPGNSLIATQVTDAIGQCTAIYAPVTSISFNRIQARVVSTGVNQSFYAYSNKLTIPGVDSSPANIGKGWRMWSPNKMTPAGPNVSGVIQGPPSTLGSGQPAVVYEWQTGSADNASLNNTKYYAPGSIVRGRAYWVKDFEGGMLEVPGSVDNNVTVYDTLTGKGWHQIGSGQFYFVDWNGGVQFARASDSPQSFMPPVSAASMGLIKNAVYWRDDINNNYLFGPDTALFPEVQMKPMAGFWFWVDTDAVVMKVMPSPVAPQETSAGASAILNQSSKYLSAVYGKQQSKSAPGDNWAVQLIAQSVAGKDLQNYVGVMPTADAASRSSLYEPPSVASGYITLGLRDPEVLNGHLSAAAYAAPISTAKSWNVEVYTDVVSPVTLTWDNVSSIPENFSAYLVTPTGTVDLRKAGSYQIAPFSGRQTLTLAVGLPEFLAGFLAAPLSKEATFVYPNPGPDNNGLMFFSHNVTAGDVKIKVYDVGGKLVKELNGTTSPIQWDTTNRFGQKIGSGVYIYIMESGGNKLVDKLAVVR